MAAAWGIGRCRGAQCSLEAPQRDQRDEERNEVPQAHLNVQIHSDPRGRLTALTSKGRRGAAQRAHPKLISTPTRSRATDGEMARFRHLVMLVLAACCDCREKQDASPPPASPKAARGSRIVAGLVAGALSSVLLQPLDVVKTRQQSSGAAHGGVIRVAVQIIKTEGMASLWSGTTPSTVRLAGGIALYFLFLGEVEQASRSMFGELTGLAAAMRDFIVGAVSRGFAATLFCPITVVKTRAEVGAAGPGNLATQLVALARTEGAAGLFAGLAPSLLRDVPYAGFSLALLKATRALLLRWSEWLSLPGAFVGAAAGAVSAACATMLTQPADVVRTELVLHHGLKDKSLGSLRALMHVVRTRGAAALFVGATARLSRRVLQQAFTWAVFEVFVASK